MAGAEAALASSIHTAPPALTAATLKAVAALPAAAAGASIAKGALITMAISKAKAAAGAAVALLLIGGGTVATYRAVRPAHEQTVVITPNVSTVSTAGADWQSNFNAVYGLAPGEVLRQVQGPFIPERQAFWDSEQRRQGGRGGWKLRNQERFTMEWDGAAAHWSSLSLNETTVSRVLQSCVKLKGWELDMDSLPMNLAMPGDWIVLKSATTQQKMDALARTVSQKIGRTVQFEKRTLPRDCIVVRGQYHFTPLAGHPDDQVIDFVGAPPDPMNRARVNKTTLGGLFRAVQDSTNQRVFDETGAGDTPITLKEYMGINNPALAIENLARQTGLEFKHETRPIDTWCMLDSSGQITTIAPPEFVKKYSLAEGQIIRHIIPPFGPERDQFWAVEKLEPTATLTPTTSLLLNWDKEPRHNQARGDCDLESLLILGLGMDWKDIDDSIPKKAPMPGDWILRDHTTVEQRMAALGPIVSAQLGRSVHFERKPVPCEVIVVSGSAAGRSGQAEPVLFADEGAPKQKSPVFHTPVQAFLRENVTALLHRRVIDQTQSPTTPIAWQAAFAGPIPIDPMLKQIEEKTGLHCVRETRPIPMWTMVDGPAADSGNTSANGG